MIRLDEARACVVCAGYQMALRRMAGGEQRAALSRELKEHVDNRHEGTDDAEVEAAVGRHPAGGVPR